MIKYITVCFYFFLSPNWLYSQECFKDPWGYLRKLEEADVPFPERNFKVIESMNACKFPDFRVMDINGDSIISSDLRGKIVVINFWFEECPPCIAEMPGLNKLTSEYDGNDVVFLGFSRDDEKSVSRFLSKRNFSYRIIPNASQMANETGISMGGWPINAILDRDGIVRYIRTGGFSKDKDASQEIYSTLKSVIDSHLP